MSKYITIVSQLDNSRIQTDIQTAKASLLLKNLIDEYDEDIIVIPGIKGEILKLIQEFLEYMKDNTCSELPKPLPNFNFKDLLKEWEYNFISRFDDNNIFQLFELINAANYLDIRELLEIACAKAALIIKDYSQEKFMEVFQIEPDLSEENYNSLIEQFQISKEDKSNKKKLNDSEEEKKLKKS